MRQAVVSPSLLSPPPKRYEKPVLEKTVPVLGNDGCGGAGVAPASETTGLLAAIRIVTLPLHIVT